MRNMKDLFFDDVREFGNRVFKKGNRRQKEGTITLHDEMQRQQHWRNEGGSCDSFKGQKKKEVR